MYLASLILQNVVFGTQILLVAVALYVVFSASKIFHLAVGAIGVTVAYTVYFGVSSGWSIALTILVACCVAILLGIMSTLLLEVFTLRDATLLGLLVSFSFAGVLEALISISFGTSGKSLQEGVLSIISFAGMQIDAPGLITIGVGGILALLTWVAISFTNAGRLLRGLAENTPLVTSLGVNNKLMRYGAYIMASLVAGVVVTLAGWHTALTPLMGFNLVIGAFVALLVGGVNDLKGTIIAAYLVALIPGIIIGLSGGFSENWRLVFVFCIAVLILGIRPNGLFALETRDS
jgi:branched-subunit amino acid ABC-type transport system permease component